MRALMQDVRYGLRMLAKSPGFTAVAIVTLALGIGANTAMFSVVNAVLLRPLPFPGPDRLVTIWGTYSRLNESKRALSYADVRDLQRMNSAFENVAAYDESSVTMISDGEAVHVPAARVNANLFTLLRMAPALGRNFSPDDDLPGKYVTILSHSLWQSQFHGDPGVIGQTVSIEGRGHTIIGVMPRGFEFPLDNDPPRLWRTYSAMATPVNGEKPETEERGAHFLAAIARLKPGVTVEQGNQDAVLVGQRLAKEFPDTNKYLGLWALPALKALVGDVQEQLLILLGAVGLVLLIGCANVANLLLARATGRQREMAIRAAMGASRGRILRQLLIESGLLAIAGGACGLAVAMWGTEIVGGLAADHIPRLAGAGLGWRVLLFTLGASVLTGIVFGLAPALQLSGLELTETLKESGRGAGTSARQNRARDLLVGAEMMLAVILLTGAGLLLKSLSKMENVNPGFQPHGVMTFAVDIPDTRYTKPEMIQTFFRQLFQRVRAIPGVESASGTVPLPLSDDVIRTSYEIEGRSSQEMDSPHVHFRAIGLDYFRTMGIPLIDGRDFNTGDTSGKVQVVIVNQKLVEDSFPGENPLGKHIKPGVSAGEVAPWREIVGVVGDVKHQALNRADTPECYVPEDQIGFDSMSGVVRTALPPSALIPAIREQVKALDPDVPIYGIKSMDDYVSESVALPRLDSTLLGIFAALALSLALVGIYGVISYGVAQRTNEIGIRMALGAQSADVLRLILGHGLGIALAGVALGTVGGLGTARLLSKLLFGVSSADPLTFATVAVALIACALAACYIPARRAAKVDPMIALRYE
jgi:putative ABC transport system permease protein